MGYTPQRLNNWVVREKIPLEECGVVARALGIKAWALCYESLVTLIGETSPTWKEALQAFTFSKEQLSYILAGTPPRNKSHILQ